jgi:hypothetical protein
MDCGLSSKPREGWRGDLASEPWLCLSLAQSDLSFRKQRLKSPRLGQGPEPHPPQLGV